MRIKAIRILEENESVGVEIADEDLARAPSLKTVLHRADVEMANVVSRYPVEAYELIASPPVMNASQEDVRRLLGILRSKGISPQGDTPMKIRYNGSCYLIRVEPWLCG